jgi:CRP/FNR family transcriptional regulator
MMIAIGSGLGTGTASGARKRQCNHDPLRVVAAQPLFASLSEEECRGLVERSVCRSVARGEILFREGQPCRGLHLLVEGRVRIYRANGEGQEQVLRILGSGESLGDVSLFDEGPYLASARVMEPGRVLFLPFAEVHSLYRTHPATAHAVVKELGERVRALAALVDQLALHDVPTRVAAAVLRYAEESGALAGGSEFRVPRTQEELAAELGTTREGVARALRELRESGVVRQRGARISVLDVPSLTRLARRRREGR